MEMLAQETDVTLFAETYEGPVYDVEEGVIAVVGTAKAEGVGVFQSAA